MTSQPPVTPEPVSPEPVSTVEQDPEPTGTATKQTHSGLSPTQLAWRRFTKDRTGVISACVVLLFFVIGLLAPVISKLYGKNPYDTYGTEEPGILNGSGLPIQPNGGISSNFWFGVEPQVGRDVFTQLIYGIRTSMMVSLGIVLVAIVVAVIIGIAAGYLGGAFDFLSGRVIDILLAFPAVLFYLAFMPVLTAAFIDPTEETPTYVEALSLIFLLAAFGWAPIARILRGQVLSLREREFVEAAKVTGAGPSRIIFKELLPNLWTPILIQASLAVPVYVTAEAGLSFLGVGITEPTPDLGRMLKVGTQFYQSDITFMVFPGVAMAIFVLAFNLLGDSIRDALDPKSRR